MSVPPASAPRATFQMLANTQAEEDAFDYVKLRQLPKPTGVVGSVAHIVKGALGGGLLGGHVAYMKSGIGVALPLNLFIGCYMCYCLYLLVWSAQVLYRRTKIPSMSYSDVGECALTLFPNKKVARFAKHFRYFIDFTISLDLFGACACYQLIIAKTIKQLVENTRTSTLEGLKEGYPGLRVYLAAMIIPVILICLITHLKYLAPFSIAANMVVLLAVFVTIYYAFVLNPSLSGMKLTGSFYSTLEFCGMITFSMSCSGVVIPIENNMREPQKFSLALVTGMSLIVCGTVLVSLFGYAGFLEECDSPITVNFPMEIAPKILKGLIASMIYVTHALNFWPPFNICFYYIRKKLKGNYLMWELIFRASFVVIIGVIAICFPNINALMGFLGTFCLSNMAFVWPLLIYLLTIWQRPGLGKYNWRLWKILFLMSIGIFIWVCGSVVNFTELISIFL